MGRRTKEYDRTKGQVLLTLQLQSICGFSCACLHGDSGGRGGGDRKYCEKEQGYLVEQEPHGESEAVTGFG